MRGSTHAFVLALLRLDRCPLFSPARGDLGPCWDGWMTLPWDLGPGTWLPPSVQREKGNL